MEQTVKWASIALLTSMATVAGYKFITPNTVTLMTGSFETSVNDAGNLVGNFVMAAAPATALPDSGLADSAAGDIGFADSGLVADSGSIDSGNVPDSGLLVDSGISPDSGILSDSGETPRPDGGAPDVGTFGRYEPPDPKVPGELPPGKIYNQQVRAEPAVGATLIDPSFLTPITRLTAAGVVQLYSQLPVFDASGSFMLLASNQGYQIYHYPDMALLTASTDTMDWNAPHWDPAHAGKMLHYDSNLDSTVRLQSFDVATKTETTLFTFPSIYRAIFGNQSFDALSRDGKWISGGIMRASDSAMIIFALNIPEARLGAQVDIGSFYTGASPRCTPDPQYGKATVDWDAPSPLGRSLFIQLLGTGACNGGVIFDIETGAYVRQLNQTHNHSDLGVDTAGREFLFDNLTASSVNNNYPALALRYLDGSPMKELRVVDWGAFASVSCQGPAGFCILSSSRIAAAGNQPFETELSMINTMDGSAIRLAHHRSSEAGYWAIPKASYSTDGSKIIYSSNWGNSSSTDLGRATTSTYMIKLR